MVAVKPSLDRAPRFADLLATGTDDAAFAELRNSELIGRPLGAPSFLADIERRGRRKAAPASAVEKPARKGVRLNRGNKVAAP